MIEDDLVSAENGERGVQVVPAAPAGGFEERLETTVSRVYVFFNSMSFRYKIAAALVAVLCLAIVSLGAVSFSQQKRVLLQEMQKRAEVLVRQLGGTAKTALLARDELGLAAIVREIGKMPGVEYVVIHDGKDKVSARAFADPKVQTAPEEAGRAALKAMDILFQQASFGGEPILEASIPLISRFESRSLRVGTARVGISQAALKEAIGRQKRVFILITAGFVVLGLVISLALGNVLTSQIVILVSAMKIVAQGDLDHPVRVQSHDDIGALAEAFNEMILKLREKLHMEKYLSSSTLQLIRRFRDVDKLKLGGEHRFVVILFSDVRGFTSMTETLDADEVVGLLNLYLNLQSEVVYKHKGTVDKFVGDEIMAIFTGDDAQAGAACAASEIQQCVASLNATRAAAGKREIQLGIGINAGEVVMGNMGSERRMDYTVIGDAVNVAARLCGAAGAGQIVMSKAVRDALGPEAETKGMESLALKGKKDPFEAFALVSMKGARRRHFRRPSRIPASFVYASLSAESLPATVRDLSCQGCVIETGHAVGIGSMLGLSVDLPELALLRDVPAVARHLRHIESGYLVGLAFPDISAESASQLSEWVHRVSTELPSQIHAAI